MKNLFVGNLNFETTEDDLRPLFSPFGEIARIQVMKDRDTGRSRGFGFVEMVTEEAAGAGPGSHEREGSAGTHPDRERSAPQAAAFRIWRRQRPRRIRTQ